MIYQTGQESSEDIPGWEEGPVSWDAFGMSAGDQWDVTTVDAPQQPTGESSSGRYQERPLYAPPLGFTTGFIGDQALDFTRESAYDPPLATDPTEATPGGVFCDVLEEHSTRLIGAWIKATWHSLKHRYPFSTMDAEGEMRFKETLRGRAKRAIDSLPNPDPSSVQATLDGISTEERIPRREKPPKDPEGKIPALMRSVFEIMKRDGPHCPERRRPYNWRRSITSKATKIWVDNREISAEELARRLKSPRGGQ